MMTEKQRQAAVAFLKRPEVEARIKAAALFAFDRKLRAIRASALPDPAKHRRADAAEKAVLTLMQSTMCSTGLIFLEAGESAALRFLDLLPQPTSGAREPEPPS